MDERLQQLKREMALGNPEASRRYRRAHQRAGSRKLLGLSTSFCIQSILNEHVDSDEIIMIIGSTIGFVENGEPGRNYEDILDRYMKSYWHKYSRETVEEAICSILPKMTEDPHGLPGTWIDAMQPYYWGWVPHGSQLGIVGNYINVESNMTTYSVEDIRSRQRQIEYRVKTIEKEAIPLNLKYGFVKPE